MLVIYSVYCPVAMAYLQEDEWLDLIPALPVPSRGILRHRRDLGFKVDEQLERLGITDRGLPPASDLPVDMPESAETENSQEMPASSLSAQTHGIGDIVRKIEAYRRDRSDKPLQARSDTPRLPLGDADTPSALAKAALSFDFMADAAGRITQSDSDLAPMLVGISLTSQEYGKNPQSRLDFAAAIRMRQPVQSQTVTISAAPAVSGDWQIDAVPIFDDLTSRFTGYAGRARRFAPVSDQTGEAAKPEDRMRQVLHELRTPAGAIQMGAEVIHQQLHGPTPHEYRAIAASIASDTALVLAGFEELERLTKLDSGTIEIESGNADLANIVTGITAQVHRHTQQRQSGFSIEQETETLLVDLDHGDLERLIWRLLAGIAGAAGSMEMLPLHLVEERTMARLVITLPESLAALTENELFHAQTSDTDQTLSYGMFGLGFTLRLAAAEAKSAGGSLRREDEKLVLSLPFPSENPDAAIEA